ncbi:hypothetical protein J6590_013173 [Homalodisca vitripennis]|nr:hypothetical protein J6590_013173 [Homalodisca vitripennis]
MNHNPNTFKDISFSDLPKGTVSKTTPPLYKPAFELSRAGSRLVTSGNFEWAITELSDSKAVKANRFWLGFRGSQDSNYRKC